MRTASAASGSAHLIHYELGGVGGAAPQWNDAQRNASLDGRLYRAARRLGRRLA